MMMNLGLPVPETKRTKRNQRAYLCKTAFSGCHRPRKVEVFLGPTCRGLSHRDHQPEIAGPTFEDAVAIVS